MQLLMARNLFAKKAGIGQKRMPCVVLICAVLCTAASEVDYPCFQKIYKGGCTEESQNDVVGETPWMGALFRAALFTIHP